MVIKMKRDKYNKGTFDELRGITFYSQYVDHEGNPCKRTRDQYPYSYDPYVTYRNGDNEEINGSMYSDRMMQLAIHV